MKEKDKYSKAAKSLLPLLAGAALMKGNTYPFSIDASSPEKRETHICKNCNEPFIPRSYNKKVFCSTKCFLEHREKSKNEK